MRRFAWTFVILLTGGVAEARQSQSLPKWDFSATAGAFEVRPGENDTDYGDGDDWYFQGRYAASIGRYWTRNLKTEVEIATSGEGSRYVLDHIRVPGTAYVQPYTVEQFHRLHQATGRIVWQFLDNHWVHPWVGAGVVLDVDQQRDDSPAHYYYPPDPRTGQPTPVRPERQSGERTQLSVGGALSGGAKFYISPNTYINSGVIVSYARPTTTVTFLTGFGIDF